MHRQSRVGGRRILVLASVSRPSRGRGGGTNPSPRPSGQGRSEHADGPGPRSRRPPLEGKNAKPIPGAPRTQESSPSRCARPRCTTNRRSDASTSERLRRGGRARRDETGSSGTSRASRSFRGSSGAFPRDSAAAHSRSRILPRRAATTVPGDRRVPRAELDGASGRGGGGRSRARPTQPGSVGRSSPARRRSRDRRAPRVAFRKWSPIRLRNRSLRGSRIEGGNPALAVLGRVAALPEGSSEAPSARAASAEVVRRARGRSVGARPLSNRPRFLGSCRSVFSAARATARDNLASTVRSAGPPASVGPDARTAQRPGRYR